MPNAPFASASSDPVGPIVLAPIALTDLVEAGLRTLLLPYQRRIRLVAGAAEGAYDVGVVDPDLLGDDWQAPDGCRVVALVRDHSSRAGLRAHELGLTDVAVIDLPAAELVTTLEAVHRNGETRPDAVVCRDQGLLTCRERDILVRICQGSSNRQIAADLYLSPNSIKSYIRTAYSKMGVSSRSQAVLWGLEHGF